MIIATIDHLKATWQRTFAPCTAKTVGMVRFAIDMEAFAIFDLALARGTLQHADGVASLTVARRVIRIQ